MDVSIIIPIYNPGSKLKKCIESILNQTHKNFELILVNDGSTDDSLNVCRNYAKYDNRIKVINQINEGAIKARRRGISESKGRYIMFVDADDWVSPIIVERLYKEAECDECDIVVGNTYKSIGNFIRKKNISSYFEKSKLYESDEIKEKLVTAYFHGHPFPANLFCKLYKRELLTGYGKYLEKIIFLGEDLFLNLEIMLKCNKIKLINEYLYFYRCGGYTSKFMDYHFNDITSGYEIQKEVINQYYEESKDRELRGISIMLLNSFKFSLYNLMKSNLNKEKILELITQYVNNDNIKEAIENKGSKSYFNYEYLNAIKNKDIEYLYNIGLDINNKNKMRNFIINTISKI